jgi:hypothetical protein
MIVAFVHRSSYDLKWGEFQCPFQLQRTRLGANWCGAETVRAIPNIVSMISVKPLEIHGLTKRGGNIPRGSCNK